MADDPTFMNYSMLDLVVAADPDHYDRDVCYEFADGKRKYLDTDNTDSGICDGL